MPLTRGARLGPYEILGPLGAGGMGEVYEARDTRLERTVAIKVLPSELVPSAEKRRRFEQEAKAIAQLSHPHICALYDVGSEGETEYLVLERLVGETLAERVSKGPLSIEQTLRYGTEIARALEKAHRQGIVHRDLKPGNVMLTASGVKLLDFGLAKLRSPQEASGSPRLSTATTVDGPLTREGTVVGTLQYMAPEQLEGRPVDARTDIFALGATLYEMATGRAAFTGTSQASLMLAILSSEPPAISTLQPIAPAALDRLVRACLAKDPDDRWQSAGDVGKELKWIAEGSVSVVAAPARPWRRRRERLAWSLAALALLCSAGVAWLSHPAKVASDLVRFTIPPPPGQSFAEKIQLSPDGGRVLFLLEDPGGGTSIWVRALDALGARRLPGSENAHSPFWSPDGREIAFFSEGRLRRMGAEGGPARTVCDVGGWGLGGSWSHQGTILFMPEFGLGIVAVPATGGVPRPVTVLDTAHGDSAHFFPEFLPDGRHFLFLSRNLDPERSEVRVGSLDAKEVLPLCHAHSAATYAASGHLLFARDNAVFAWRFDADRLRLQGEPTPVFEDVRYGTENFRLTLTTAGDRVAYRRWSLQRRLVWVDRKGRELGTVGEVRGYEDVRLSPDGRRLAVTVRDPAHGQNLDVWVLDAARGTGTRVTTEPTDEFNPAWFPDGERLVYVSDHAGFYGLFERPASGGPERVVLVDRHDVILPSVSADGRFLLGQTLFKATSRRLLLPLSGAGEARRLGGGGTFFEGQPQVSPDGRWCAFVSNLSGQREVYVEPLPEGPRVQISVGGGDLPVWRRDGREVFYVAKDGVLASVAVRLDAGRPEVGEPQPLFPIRYVASNPEPAQRPYDVAPDGERFVVIRPVPDVEPDDAVVVMNWTEALRGAR